MKKLVQGVTSSLSLLFIKEQVEYIRGNGFEVKVVCNDEAVNANARMPVDHIPFDREINLRNDPINLYRLYMYLRRESPDIINFGTPKAGLLGMIAGYLSGVETRIYIQRGLRLETVSGMKKMILYMTEKIACTLSTHVMVISDSLEREVIRRRLVRPRKIVRIGRGSSSGINLERFSPEVVEREKVESLAERLGIQPSDFIIGYVGRIAGDKGSNELIEAFATLSDAYPNIKLLIIGDFEAGDPIEDVHRKTITNHDRIIREPYTDKPEHYYMLMDLFVLPTYREGFSNVSIEAQAMGVPVITFDATGARDTIDPGTTGLIVPSNDARGIEASLELLMNDDEKRREMSKNAPKFIRTHFDRKHMHEQLLAFYNTL
ncbi:glycosyltransferase family 4 protein [Salinicoccus roseus]|nr:glycosyltransferase family 4 protein [Salinicoccus roseus]